MTACGSSARRRRETWAWSAVGASAGARSPQTCRSAGRRTSPRRRGRAAARAPIADGRHRALAGPFPSCTSNGPRIRKSSPSSTARPYRAAPLSATCQPPSGLVGRPADDRRAVSPTRRSLMRTTVIAAAVIAALAVTAPSALAAKPDEVDRVVFPVRRLGRLRLPASLPSSTPASSTAPVSLARVRRGEPARIPYDPLPGDLRQRHDRQDVDHPRLGDRGPATRWPASARSPARSSWAPTGAGTFIHDSGHVVLDLETGDPVGPRPPRGPTSANRRARLRRRRLIPRRAPRARRPGGAPHGALTAWPSARSSRAPTSAGRRSRPG